MSLCVVLNAEGTHAPTGQSVETCTGYVLASPAEIWISSLVAEAFEAPEPEVAAAWFAGVFSLVVICFMAGRAVGAVVASVR